jgi:hypothetical protein
MDITFTCAIAGRRERVDDYRGYLMDESALTMLGQWPDDVRGRALAVDKVLMERVPGLRREADPDDRLMGYMLDSGYKGTLFTILLSKSGVKVGFSHGATLPDPAGLLGGSGKVHRAFTVGSVDDVDKPAFLKLLDAAYTAYRERMGL